MASLNQVSLIGFVGDEPKVIATQSGKPMATLSLATTEKGFTRQDGTSVPDKTEWHNITIFGNLSKVVQSYVHKGSALFVQGKITYRSFDGKDGQKKYVTEIVADNLQLLDRKSATTTATASTDKTRSEYVYEPPF
ncbi:MAG: single-stranded DNA-binding protein [Bacteroidales bacterium]|nr:single-stranded DNA-binding protein [Bacteroidales bacterium]